MLITRHRSQQHLHTTISQAYEPVTTETTDEYDESLYNETAQLNTPTHTRAHNPVIVSD